eukprot:Skav222145  [mRNA]  locus=scaffold4223:20415:26774:+ [translate_table: standard]
MTSTALSDANGRTVSITPSAINPSATLEAAPELIAFEERADHLEGVDALPCRGAALRGGRAMVVDDGGWWWMVEMSSCETIFNLANTMMGSGVLAVPYAFRLTSYWAVLLLLLVVALTAFTACLIGEALQIARHRSGTLVSNHRDFTFLAEAGSPVARTLAASVVTAW